MDPLRRHLRRCRGTAGVSSRARASEEGVHPSTWNRYVARECWARPYEGIAIAPWAPDLDAAALAAVALAHGGAASGPTARWLHGLGPRPPRLEVTIPHARSVRAVAPDPAPPPPPGPGADDEARRADHAARRAVAEGRRWLARCRRIRVRRCRWLCSDDVVIVRGVPTLAPAATALTIAAGHPEQLRPYLIDARHARRVDLDEVRDRLRAVGSLRGRHLVVRTLDELADRHPESILHDEVLTHFEGRGYRPSRAPTTLPTPRGRDVPADIPLRDWKVVIEIEGDLYHRDRAARRRDRDKQSAYASSEWVLIVVDSQIWAEDRERVEADVDAAILAQRRRGIGVDAPLPPHLAVRVGG